jgi:putative SOS response-associated peptidase YedK
MCGRYATRRDKQKIAEAFQVGKIFAEPLAPNYNIAPSTFQPVIREERDSTDREMVLMRWGLVPYFAKTLAEWKGLGTINAKAETVSASNTWRGPFQSRRCIVPADYFYEWKTLGDSKKSKKQPYAISLKSGEPMAFAGLWDAWKEPKPASVSIHTPDTWLQTFSIVTTEANELMSEIHTRMPVILHQRDWARWLDRTVTEQPPLDLLRPYDSDEMEIHPCNPLVGNVRNNGPEMLNAPEMLEAQRSEALKSD